MASWTNLTTTYTTNTLITVDIWNKLTSYYGNTQWLKDILDYYAINEYYTTGFRTSTSFVMPIAPSISTFDTPAYIDTDEKTDVYPDEVVDQFFDVDNDSYIKIRKNGKYILTTHYNPVTFYNTGLGINQSQTFDFLIDDKSISKTNFAGSNIDSDVSRSENTTTPVHNFFMGRLDEGEVVIPQILYSDYYANKSIATFSGSNTSFANDRSGIFAKGPYVASVYLNTPTLDISPPETIYTLIGGRKQYTDSIFPEREYWDAYAKTLVNTNLQFTNEYNTAEPPSRTKYFANSWISSFDTTYNLKYTYPKNFTGYLVPKAVWTDQFSLSPYSGTFKARYMIFAIKALDIYNSMAANTEQNIFSIEMEKRIASPGPEYIGTPFQLTAFYSGTKITFNIRKYTQVTQVQFDNMTKQDRLFFALQVTQNVNGVDLFWPRLYINNTEVASVSATSANLTSYELNYDDDTVYNHATFGGVDYYAVQGDVTKNSMYTAFYFIGNYELSDPIKANGVTYDKEKQYIWKYLPPKYSFVNPNYSWIVLNTTAGMIVDTWTFGTLKGLA